MIPNLGDRLQLLTLFASAAVTASGNGTGVDLLDYDGEMCAAINSGAGTGTSPTLDIKLQDSADNSSFADVAGLSITQITTAASLQKISFSKDEVRRYVRAVRTVGGTTPSFPVGVSLLGVKKYEG